MKNKNYKKIYCLIILIMKTNFNFINLMKKKKTNKYQKQFKLHNYNNLLAQDNQLKHNQQHNLISINNTSELLNNTYTFFFLLKKEKLIFCY